MVIKNLGTTDGTDLFTDIIEACHLSLLPRFNITSLSIDFTSLYAYSWNHTNEAGDTIELWTVTLLLFPSLLNLVLYSGGPRISLSVMNLLYALAQISSTHLESLQLIGDCVVFQADIGLAAKQIQIFKDSHGPLKFLELSFWVGGTLG